VLEGSEFGRSETSSPHREVRKLRPADRLRMVPAYHGSIADAPRQLVHFCLYLESRPLVRFLAVTIWLKSRNGCIRKAPR
jgi:hypothetical protein